MNLKLLLMLELIVSFLPFVLFVFFNSKANIKKENRNRQYLMPVFAVLYSVVLLIFFSQLSLLFTGLFLKIAKLFERVGLSVVAILLRTIYKSWGIYLELVLFNTVSLAAYVIVKRILTAILANVKVRRNTFVASVVELFYSYDELNDRWYIKEHYGQACKFTKTAYYGCCFAAGLTMLISCVLCMLQLVSVPFYPVFAVIIIGELAFFVDGLEAEEQKNDLEMQADNARHVAMYPLLRKPLKALFGDKLSAEGTSVNNGGISGGSIEDILTDLEKTGGHIGNNYAAFIRKKMKIGLKPNIDYVRCGFDLASGKSLLFNTPFYDKLNPYLFYAMNRELLTGGKILIILGRHGTEEDLLQWSGAGMQSVSNVPDLWKVRLLKEKPENQDDLPDIGVITRSGVHDLGIHKNNLMFLRGVSFVFIVEPSKLVTTAQIGLNLLIKNCGKKRAVTFCSVDRNCDGLVDALSHILMTNITEVSSTEYPHGVSSYMYWTADDDYLQHRIIPGISRCLGIGTELSIVAMKNHVKRTVWYGGDAYPVQDSRWIAKQYYYELLDYARLPTNQETFDRCFQTSFNMCDERVSDYSFITVEDDRNNLFETRRNFATIAEQQGFVNVISSEYMLREYMASNTGLFTTDAKAIPYVTADFARTRRNAILSLCLLLCIDSVQEETLIRQMVMLNIDTKDPVSVIWNDVCMIFGNDSASDKYGTPVLSVKNRDGKTVWFEKDSTIIFKRAYNIESGRFESVYTIESAEFSRIILDDLQYASYIAEQESKDVYIGTELKGHIYQKYLPGQFFTLNGKYYEMVSTATDNRILVRRASEHIGGRLAFRQIRKYTIHHLENSGDMGALKSVNNIDIHYQFADFSVETPGYWKMRACNDFDRGELVSINGVPDRAYHHKQILKFDFSGCGEAFTDSVRMTLTNLLNEVFVTLFADNQPYISAVTPGQYEAPLTYSLDFGKDVEHTEKCIFIIEDSQLDIGLLVAVERNVNRILQIIADYLEWNDGQIAESIRGQNEPVEKAPYSGFDVYAEEEPPEKKKGFFGRIFGWIKGIFKKKEKPVDGLDEEGLSPRQRRKAERAAKRAEKKAEKERKKQEKKERREASSEAEAPVVEEVESKAPADENDDGERTENDVAVTSEENGTDTALTEAASEDDVAVNGNESESSSVENEVNEDEQR